LTKHLSQAENYPPIVEAKGIYRKYEMNDNDELNESSFLPYGEY
jgi:hypothetical protein